MALLLRGEDGEFLLNCPICNQPLREPIYATTHFLSDETHHLWPFSDAGMHWDCFVEWGHRDEFADLYFESKKSWENPLWPMVLEDEEVRVRLGMVGEFDIDVRKMGSGFRVAWEDWAAFLEGGWKEFIKHPWQEGVFREVLFRLMEMPVPAKPDYDWREEYKKEFGEYPPF